MVDFTIQRGELNFPNEKRGDSFIRRIVLRQPDPLFDGDPADAPQVPIDLTDISVLAQVREHDDYSLPPTLQWFTDDPARSIRFGADSESNADRTKGEMELFTPKETMQQLTPFTNATFELQIEDVEGNRDTILTGTFTLAQDYAHRETT